MRTGNPAEAHRLLNPFGRPTAVRDGQFERIEIRSLCAPLDGVLHREPHLGAAPLRLRAPLGHGDARRIAQRQLHAAHRGGGLQRHPQRGVRVVVVELRRDEEVLEARLLAGTQLDAARNAREAPEVLVLEVGAVAPAENLQRQQVLTLAQILRHVEIGRQLAVLAVAHKAAVEPHVDVRRGRADAQADILARP